MKDFLIAEYKTIILVLLFCAGIFSWFYVRELQKDAEKEQKVAWNYQCMKPGQWASDYKIGQDVPAFDDLWETTTDIPNATVWHHNGGDLTVAAQNNVIRSIEIYPSGEKLDLCAKDFDEWTQNNKLLAEPIKLGEITYSRYPGVISVTKTHDDETTNLGWIINDVMN